MKKLNSVSLESVSAFHKIVLLLPRKTRQSVASDVQVVQKALGDTVDLLSDRRGKHWATKRLEPQMVYCDMRGQGEWTLSCEDAAALVGLTPQSLKWRLSYYGFATRVTSDEEIVTILPLEKDGSPKPIKRRPTAKDADEAVAALLKSGEVKKP